MTNDNEKFQNILSEALEHYENGKSITEILDLYPESRKELQEIFQTIQLLARVKEGAIPPKELLAKIILELQPVSESQKSKEVVIDSRGEIKGRPSIDLIKHQITNLMTWNWKILLPIGIVAVLAVVVLFIQFGTKAPQVTEKSTQGPVVEQSTPTPTTEKPAPLPKATGNVDDAVNAILTAIDNEQAVLAEEEGDVSLVAADSQAISDFGQAYNENEF